MKKTYIAPFCKIREVQKCNIIATSGMDTVNNEVPNGGNSNRFGRGSWWDDDDDE